jgi:hypothetical protein
MGTVNAGLDRPLLSPVSFRCSRRIAGNDRTRTTRHTDALLLLVADTDFPDPGRAPDMQRDRRRGQKSLADSTDMVGIDFLPEGDQARRRPPKWLLVSLRLRSLSISPGRDRRETGKM